MNATLKKLVALTLAFILAFETSFLNPQSLAWGSSYQRSSGPVAQNNKGQEAQVGAFSPTQNAATLAGRRRGTPLVLRPRASNPSQVQLALSRSVATAETEGEAGEIVLTATVQDDLGQPVSGVYVSWKVDKAITVNPESGYTDAAGNISTTVSSIEALTSTVRLLVGGTYEFDTGQLITFERPTYQVVAGDLIIEADTVLTTNLYVQGDLVVSGAVVLLVGQRLIEAENIIIGANARISADGTGHGAGRGASPGWPKQDSATGGGGHGGHGGQGSLYPPDTDPAWPGAPYGEMASPERMGSSGGVRNNDLSCPGKGGGAIKLVARGVFTHEGVISANGTDAAPNSACGGGSGGSIWISATHLSGSGLIQANGGSGDTYTYNDVELRGGGGSGGRIALYGSYTGPARHRLEALAGLNGLWGAENGTALHIMPIDVNASQLTSTQCFAGRRNYETFEIRLDGPDGPVINRPLKIRVEPAQGWVRYYDEGIWTGWEELGWWNSGNVRIGRTDSANGTKKFELAFDHFAPVTLTVSTEDGTVITSSHVLTFANMPITNIGWSVQPRGEVAIVGEQITVTGRITGVSGELGPVQTPIQLDLIRPDGSVYSSIVSAPQGQFTATLTSDSQGLHSLVAYIREACAETPEEGRFNGPSITFRVLPSGFEWLTAPVLASVTPPTPTLVTFTGRLLDTESHPIASHPVSLAVTPSSTLVSIVPELAETDVEGVFTATLIAIGTGFYYVVARTEDSLGNDVESQTGIQFIAEPLLATLQTADGRSSFFADSSAVPLTFTLRTATGDPVFGWNVEARVEGEGVVLGAGMPAGQWHSIGGTNPSGNAYFSVRSSQPGPAVVHARAFRTAAYTVSHSTVITFISPIPRVTLTEWHSNVSDRSEMPDSGLLTVTLRGAGGQPIAGRPISVQCTVGELDCAVSGLYVSSGIITTNVNGQATAALSFTPTLASSEPFTASFHLDVLPPPSYEEHEWVTQRFEHAFQLRMLPSQASITQSYAVISPSAVFYSDKPLLDPSLKLSYTLTLKDRWGRILPGYRVRLSLLGSLVAYFYAEAPGIRTVYTTTNEIGEISLPIYYRGQRETGHFTVRAEQGYTDNLGYTVYRPVTTTSEAQVVPGPIGSIGGWGFTGPISPQVGYDSVFITATIYDSYTRPLPSRVITLAPREGCCADGLIISSLAARTDQNGQMGFRISATQPLTANLRAVVLPSVLGDAITASVPFTVTFTGVSPFDLTDPLRSTLVANRQAQFAGSADPFILVTATLRNMEDQPIRMRPVVLKVEGSRLDAVEITSGGNGGLTNQTGVISWTIRSTEPQTLTLRVVDTRYGITLNQVLTANFVPGPMGRWGSHIQIEPGYLRADGTQSALISATLRDERNRLLTAYPVRLVLAPSSSTQGQPIITPTSLITTDERGQVQFYVSSLQPGRWQAQLLSDHMIESRFTSPLAWVEFYGEPVTHRSTIAVSKNPALAYGTDDVLIMAHLRDERGSPVPYVGHTFISSRQDVTLSQFYSVTQIAGEAFARLKAHEPGPVTVQLVLSDGRVIRDAVINFYAPLLWRPNSQITLPLTHTVADGLQTALVRATLRNLQGVPVANRYIQLLSEQNDVLFPGGQVKMTDAQGTVTFTLASRRSGHKHLRLREVASGEQMEIGYVLFVASVPDAAQSTLRLNKTVAYVDNDFIQLTLELRDAYRNPVANHPVTVNAGSLVSVTKSRTDLNGVLAVTLRSPVPHITAVAVSVPVSGGEIMALPTTTVSFVRRFSLSGSDVSITPKVITAGAQSTVTVIAQLRDELGNAVPDQRIRLSVVLSGSATEAPVQVLPASEAWSDAQGRAAFTVNSSRSGEFLISLIDLERATLITRTVVQFIPGPPDLSRSRLELVNPNYLLQPGDATYIAAVLQDEFGNPVSNWRVRFELSSDQLRFPYSNDSGRIVTRTSDQNGRAAFSFTSQNPQDIAIVAKDALSGDQIGQTLQVRFVRQFSPEASEVETLYPGQAQANAQDSVRVRVRVKGDDGNAVSEVPLYLTLRRRGDASSVRHTLYSISPTSGLLSNADGEALFEVRSARSGSFFAEVYDDANRLIGASVVTFTPGAIAPEKTRIQLMPFERIELPADGVTPYNVTVSVGDSLGNPISGAVVYIEAQGESGISVVQPSAPTDASGQVVGLVFGTSRSPFTLQARVNGQVHPAQVQARFGGPDVAIEQRVLQPIYVGRQLEIETLIVNRGVLTAQGVVAESALDERLTPVEQIASTAVFSTQAGSRLRWEIAELAPGKHVLVRLVASAQSAEVGDVLQLSTVITVANGDDNSVNNSAAITATVLPTVSYEARIPQSTWVMGSGVGNRITYTLRLTNTGIVSDVYEVFLRLPNGVSFLPADLATPVSENERLFRVSQVALNAGDFIAVPVEIGLNQCEAAGVYGFDVLVSSAHQPITRVLTSTLHLLSEPDLLSVQPVSGFRTARGIVFSWLTHSADASGLVRLRPQANASAEQVYPSVVEPTNDGLFKHIVVVNDLGEGEYVWETKLTSQCGAATTPPAHLRVARGIGFVASQHSAVVERDYNQRIPLRLINFDDRPRQVSVTVAAPDNNEDLRFGFVGDGSPERLVDLLPGEMITVHLFIHAQDAHQLRYDLVARASSVPENNNGAFGIASAVEDAIFDQTLIKVILSPSTISYTLEEISSGYAGGAQRYRLTNHGSPLTDINIDARTISGTGSLFIHPRVEHAYLRPGDSIEFEAVPVVDKNFTSLEAEITINGLNGRLKTQKPLQVSRGNRGVYVGRATNVVVQAGSSGWYCTNNPDISYDIPLPHQASGYFPDEPPQLRMTFSPYPEALPHNTHIQFNEKTIANFIDVVPNGDYQFSLDPLAIRSKLSSDRSYSPQLINIRTKHMNEGHYVVQTGATLHMCYGLYEEEVIASSQEEADTIVRARPYIRPAPQWGSGRIRIINPSHGQVVFAGEPVRIAALVEDSSSANNLYVLLPNGNRVPMTASATGEYAIVNWIPDQIGIHKLIVASTECGQDKAEVVVRVDTSPADDDGEGGEPWIGSFFRAYPSVALPDGRSKIVVTLTLRNPTNGVVISGANVLIYDRSFGLSGIEAGRRVSVTGVTNERGQFSITLTSTVPGAINVTAHDLTNDQPVTAFVTVNFAVKGKVRANPPALKSNGIEKAYITVTLGSDSTPERVHRATIFLRLKNDVGESTILSKTLVNSVGVVTAVLTSTVSGNHVISAFVLLPSTPSAVPLLIGRPTTIRFYDSSLPIHLKIDPPITYTAFVTPYRAVATFRVMDSDVRAVTVTLTTTRPLSDHLSKLAGVTDDSGVFTVAISSTIPGESSVLFTFFDEDMSITRTLSRTVRFLHSIRSITITPIAPNPPIFFPHEKLVITGTVKDATGQPATDRPILVQLQRRRDNIWSTMIVSPTTDAQGHFRVEIDDDNLGSGLYKMDAYESLGDPGLRHDWIHLENLGEFFPVFVATRPVSLVLTPTFVTPRGEFATFTASVKMLVGVYPYERHPSVNTPLKLEVRRLPENDLVYTYVVTTNNRGAVTLRFTQPATPGQFNLRVVNMPANLVAAEKNFFIPPFGSSCQGFPKIVSYATNYKLGQDVIYPQPVHRNHALSATLAMTLAVNWNGCYPGKILVKVGDSNTREYSARRGSINSSGQAVYELHDITNLFGSNEPVRLISVWVESQDEAPSEKLALVHRTSPGIRDVILGFLGLSSTPEALKFLFTGAPVIAAPLLEQIQYVRHPVTGRSVPGKGYSIIFPHPSDRFVTPLSENLKFILGILRGTKIDRNQRDVKEKNPKTGYRFKRTNLILISVPFVCDAGPYAKFLTISSHDKKFKENARRPEVVARAVSSAVKLTDKQKDDLYRLLDKRAEKKGENEKAKVNLSDKKVQYVFKISVSFGLSNFLCRGYLTESGLRQNPIQAFTSGKIGFDVQIKKTWPLVTLLLRLVPGVGMPLATAVDFICNHFGQTPDACGPEIMSVYGGGVGIGPLDFTYNFGTRELTSPEYLLPYVRLRLLGAIELAIAKSLFLQAEASVGAKLYFALRTVPQFSFCLHSLGGEFEAFFKAVVFDLWATEYALQEKPELIRDVRCEPPANPQNYYYDFDLDAPNTEIHLDYMGDDTEVDDQVSDIILSAPTSELALLHANGAASALDQLANEMLDVVEDLDLPNWLSMPLAYTQGLTSPAKFKLIPPMGRGDPTYAAFAERPGRLTAFSKPEAMPTNTAARVTTVNSVLVSNIFTHTSVAMAHEPNGDRSILVWSHSNPDGPAGGNRELMYSMWDGSSWSQPRVVSGTRDNVADLMPSVIWDARGRVVLAWTRATRPLTDTPNFSFFEIATSIYDPNTDQWTAVNLVTRNSHADTLPRLAHDGQGRVMLLWHASHPTLGSVILSSMLNDRGNRWSTTEVASDRPLLSFDVAYNNGQAALVGLSPVTGSTGVTLQVFLARRINGAWQPSERVSSDANANHRSAAIAYDTDGKVIVGWIANGRIMLRKLDGAAQQELSTEGIETFQQSVSEFRLLRSPQGNLAILLRDSHRPPALYVLPLDTRSRELGLIGIPILLSNVLTESVLSLDAGFSRDGRLLAGYVRVVNDAVTATHSYTEMINDVTGPFIPSAPRVVTREVVFIDKLVPRRADLLTLARLPGRDMVVIPSVEYSTVMSSSVLISVSVEARNEGDFAENVDGNALRLEFYEGHPDVGGRLVESVSLTQAIPPGGRAEYAYGFVVSSTEQLTLAVRLVNEGEPYLENNTALIPLTFGSVPRVSSLEGVSMTETSSGARAGIYAFGLSNDGFVTSTSSIMTVTVSQDEQPVVGQATVTVPPIAPNAVGVLTATIPLVGLRGKPYTLTAELSGVERRFVTVQKVPGDLVLEHAEWTDLSYAPVLLDVRVRNNSWFTASDAVLWVSNGGSNTFYKRTGTTEPVGEVGPGEAVTMTLTLTQPQLCGIDLYVTSPSIEETNAENNALFQLNDRLCFGVSLDVGVEPIQTLTNALLGSSDIPTPSIMPSAEGVAPLRVRVTATTQLTNAQWLWSFGDGVTDTRQSPGVHTYTQAGSYVIQVTAIDPESGATAYADRYVAVYSPTLPIIGCDGCDSARVGQTIVLTNASEGKIEDMYWSLGDDGITVTGSIVNHAYTTPGVYTVTLNVRGLEGDWRAATRMITVTSNLTHQVYLPSVMKLTAEAALNRQIFLPYVRQR